ncbi:receptor-interacting serine/threonine-protein kinase 1 [Chrysoperla carnea]|uniref:receptor-interacting serine/threonine-protein kinase 1 n=1 Tax=Chrysoperla carnea TaxID=189513 RepID=UPI001D0753A8|nr:receptor-interacting serine/threonine-protein kinase 1 [Chrysoperla carnea]
MDTESENLVTDAIPDPPRVRKVTPQQNTETPEETNNQDEVPKNNTYENNSDQDTKKKSKKRNTKSKSGITVNGISIANSIGVRIGNDITNNHYINTKIPGGACVNETSQSWKPKHQNDDVEIDFIKVAKLLTSNEKLETKHLDVISDHVGELWTLLGKKLGYSQGQLQQFKINHDEFDIKEVIYQMLLNWTQMNPEKATVAIIIEKLLSCNLKEVVKIFYG